MDGVGAGPVCLAEHWGYMPAVEVFQPTIYTHSFVYIILLIIVFLFLIIIFFYTIKKSKNCNVSI